MPLYSATAQQLAWLFFRWEARDPPPVTLTWALPGLTHKVVAYVRCQLKEEREAIYTPLLWDAHVY